jgi:hypothetical protein
MPPPVQSYYLIREATTGSVRIIHRVRDSAICAFNELIAEGDFDECIELMEVVVNDRGRVFAEAVLHSYSKLGRYVVTHVVTPTIRPVPVRPLIGWPGTPGRAPAEAGAVPPPLELPPSNEQTPAAPDAGARGR